MNYINELAKNAREATTCLTECSIAVRNEVITYISQLLIENTDYIISENQKDIQNAASNGVLPHMIDRLMLDSSRIKAIANAALKLVDLPDYVGRVLGGEVRPNGLSITKVSVPLGVVCTIYESRPNVTVDVALLCLKTANVAVLRGGKEAYHTNLALSKLMRQALARFNLDENIISFVEDTSRDTARELMRLNEYIDVLIPRGGAGLISTVVQNATIPVIETGAGNCHVYVDRYADVPMALSVVDNAKTQRPSVCNACETLLVHSGIADEFIPKIANQLLSKSVQLICCPDTLAILEGAGMVDTAKADTIPDIIGDIIGASEEDYYTEYNDYKLTIKVVPSLQAGINHINHYSTKHSECIITKDIQRATTFTSRVNSAVVYVNASTRFTDGEEFGFGAEIGISTQKLHARGPMGLEALTTYKYIVQGNGQTR